MAEKQLGTAPTNPTDIATKGYVDGKVLTGSGGAPSTYSATIGNGSATSIAVTHGLGTRNVVVSVYLADTNEEVECDVTLTSSDVVTLTFSSAPASSSLRCVIVGGSSVAVGPTGPAGTNATVTHGSVASTARPTASGAVVWIGSVTPTNATDGDLWVDISGEAPAITTTTLNSLNVGATMSQKFLATGTAPLIWSSTGTLPGGLSFSQDGELYGTPTASTYNFSVTCRNAYTDPANIATRSFSGTVGPAIGPTITSNSALGSFSQGTPLSGLALTASGSQPITWEPVTGVGTGLPGTLTLSGGGVISGTPSANGTITFRARATNSVDTVTKDFTLSVSGTQPTINPSLTLDPIWRSFDVSQTITATGSDPKSWSLSGTLASSLAISSSGVLSGKPTVVGSNYTLTITVSNGYGTPSSKTFTNVAVFESAPVIAQTSAANFTNSLRVGSLFTQQMSLSSGGPASKITWSLPGVSGTDYPSWLNINFTTGVLSGTPPTTAPVSFTVRASNGVDTANQPFTNVPVSGNSVAFRSGSAVTSTSAAGVLTGTLNVNCQSGDTIIVFVRTPNGYSATSATYTNGVTGAVTNLTPLNTSIALSNIAPGGSGAFGNLTGFTIVGAAGSGTITATVAGFAFTPTTVTIEAAAYSGVGLVEGYISTAANNDQPISLNVSGGLTGGMIVGNAIGNSGTPLTVYAGTSRTVGSICDIAATTGTLKTLTWTAGYGGRGVMAVILNPA
jgi:hypothetical protein